MYIPLLLSPHIYNAYLSMQMDRTQILEGLGKKKRAILCQLQVKHLK